MRLLYDWGRKGRRCPLFSIVIHCILIATVSGQDKFESLFDGRTLNGWQPTGDPSYWSVEEGAIIGRISSDHPCAVNQYLVWKGGEQADFELKLRSRLRGEGGINNGFQFRSRLLPDGDVCGYQVDNNLLTPWLVRLYDEYGRHTLAMRGERTIFDRVGLARTEPIPESTGEPWFQLGEWHEYHLTCIGSHLTLRVDDRLVAEVVDDDERRQELQGILALQLHSGPPTQVEFKDIRWKMLRAADRPQPTIERLTSQQEELRRSASAWWNLDEGGHGATPLLRHVPAFEQFELNVRAQGAGARSQKVVLLHGAYFEGTEQPRWSTDGFSVFIRLRDASGEWQATWASQNATDDTTSWRLFGDKLPGTAGTQAGDTQVALELRTPLGVAMAHFPADTIDRRAWHDIAGTFDGQRLAIYCDGDERNTSSLRTRLDATARPVIIAGERQRDDITRRFHGEMERAAMWSRGLTPSEVAELSRSERSDVRSRTDKEIPQP